jgi:hypothetical protein
MRPGPDGKGAAGTDDVGAKAGGAAISHRAGHAAEVLGPATAGDTAEISFMVSYTACQFSQGQRSAF